MTKIEQQVMASVGAIYLGRMLTSATALKLYILLVSFVGLASLVSLPHVEANFLAVESSGLSGVGNFLLVAILKTQTLVRVALLIGAVAVFSLLGDALRAFSRRTLALA